MLEQNKSNGQFTGGSNQLPHIASTYSAVLSLIEIGGSEAYKIIDKKAVYKTFM